ncbi:MAG: hypothetical protein M1165_02510 [Candidatus Pacearchaeota archaeon]|nr:hypothetical protein [Candidatus Pacearchaeota archaeon]
MKILEENNFEKARKAIREEKVRGIIFTTSDDELSRKILEKEKINILLIKQRHRKDGQKQRNSGLDSVIVKLAKKSDVGIGICIDEIINSFGNEKAEILGRIRQNIMLCAKEKVRMKFITENDKNKRDARDLKSLGLVLGMPTWMSADAG